MIRQGFAMRMTEAISGTDIFFSMTLLQLSGFLLCFQCGFGQTSSLKRREQNRRAVAVFNNSALVPAIACYAQLVRSHEIRQQAKSTGKAQFQLSNTAHL